MNPFPVEQFQQRDKDMLEEGHAIVTIWNYVRNTWNMHNQSLDLGYVKTLLAAETKISVREDVGCLKEKNQDSKLLLCLLNNL